MLFGSAPPWLWIAFAALIVTCLAVDLGVFNRDEHVVRAREALAWFGVWILLALAFDILIYVWFGPQKALEYLTGFVIEKALSVDNIFVFIVIFSFFSVPRQYQHKVLFWGVIGAFVLRAVFIFVGAALLNRFHWMLYLFGAFLVFTGIKIFVTKEEEEVDPAKSLIVRAFRAVFPVGPAYDGAKFLTRHAGKLVATPLLVVLAMVEGTDVIFALDSIPAIFGVTTDPFIVYTSNIFAILGLRNLYFVLADFMDRFEYLKFGLAVVLVFVGAKMLIVYFDVVVPIGLSLGVIAAVLGVSVAISWVHGKRSERSSAP